MSIVNVVYVSIQYNMIYLQYDYLYSYRYHLIRRLSVESYTVSVYYRYFGLENFKVPVHNKITFTLKNLGPCETFSTLYTCILYKLISFKNKNIERLTRKLLSHRNNWIIKIWAVVTKQYNLWYRDNTFRYIHVCRTHQSCFYVVSKIDKGIKTR